MKLEIEFSLVTFKLNFEGNRFLKTKVEDMRATFRLGLTQKKCSLHMPCGSKQIVD